jgi:hypothetical protein
VQRASKHFSYQRIPINHPTLIQYSSKREYTNNANTQENTPKKRSVAQEQEEYLQDLKRRKQQEDEDMAFALQLQNENEITTKINSQEKADHELALKLQKEMEK